MTTTGRLCEARNGRGEPCQVRALAGSSFCWFHDPDKAAERKAARIKGGKARHGRSLAGTGNHGPAAIETVGDVVGLLSRTVNDVLTLENSIQRARALGYLAGVIVKALELSDLEKRVEALEARVGEVAR